MNESKLRKIIKKELNKKLRGYNEEILFDKLKLYLTINWKNNIMTSYMREDEIFEMEVRQRINSYLNY